MTSYCVCFQADKIKRFNFRLLNEIDDTIKLVTELSATGISAIAVHGRKKHERPKHANNTGKY